MPTPTQHEVIAVIRNDTAGRITFVSGTDDGPDETTYIMQRPAGGGTIVGGCYQAGRIDPEPDPAMAERILERAVKLVPSLTNGQGRAGLDVVRHGVGLRPVRKGGYRVEREQQQGWTIVHKITDIVWVLLSAIALTRTPTDVGSQGAGYQCSYGCADEAVDLVKESSRFAEL